jgi:hypothetical protein
MMKSCVVRDRKLTVAAASALLSLLCLGACEDKRVSQLDTGITRDSAVSVLATKINGGGHDSLPNVYTQDRYRINGKTYDVLYFTPNNEKASKDSVPWGKLTPLVFVDNKLVAKKWSEWDSISKANNIPLKKR